MAMLVADAIGWAGAACLLLAYARLSSGQLAVGMRYHLLNLAGAGGLAANGAFHQAWPSTALNLIRLGIGLTALHGVTGAKVRTSTLSAASSHGGHRSARAIQDRRWIGAARSGSGVRCASAGPASASSGCGAGSRTW